VQRNRGRTVAILLPHGCSVPYLTSEDFSFATAIAAIAAFDALMGNASIRWQQYEVPRLTDRMVYLLSSRGGSGRGPASKGPDVGPRRLARERPHTGVKVSTSKKPRRSVKRARQFVHRSTTKNFRVPAQLGNTILFAPTRQMNIHFRRHRRVARRHNNATGHLKCRRRALKTLSSALTGRQTTILACPAMTRFPCSIL
jgi:hypothetical protein